MEIEKTKKKQCTTNINLHNLEIFIFARLFIIIIIMIQVNLFFLLRGVTDIRVTMTLPHSTFSCLLIKTNLTTFFLHHILPWNLSKEICCLHFKINWCTIHPHNSQLVLTFSRFVLYVDGLCLVCALVILHTNQVRVCLWTEDGSQCHDMLVGVIQHLHELGGNEWCWSISSARVLLMYLLNVFLRNINEVCTSRYTVFKAYLH